MPASQSQHEIVPGPALPGGLTHSSLQLLLSPDPGLGGTDRGKKKESRGQREKVGCRGELSSDQHWRAWLLLTALPRKLPSPYHGPPGLPRSGLTVCRLNPGDETIFVPESSMWL